MSDLLATLHSRPVGTCNHLADGDQWAVFSVHWCCDELRCTICHMRHRREDEHPETTHCEHCGEAFGPLGRVVSRVPVDRLHELDEVACTFPSVGGVVLHFEGVTIVTTQVMHPFCAAEASIGFGDLEF